MKDCTYRLSLDELIARSGLLALIGADGEPAGSDAKGEGDESEDKSNKSDEDGDKDDKGKKAAPSPEEKRIAGLEEEKQRHYDKRVEAENALKEANKRIKQLEKDGTPDDALKTSNDELTKTNEKLLSVNQTLMLENAFLKATGYDWVDPEAALRLADLSEVEFDEKTNKAVGLESALAKIAKDKPYLLKPKAKDGDDKDEDKGKPAPRQSGKAPAGGQQKKTDAEIRDQKLRQKYPALRRR